MHEADDPRKHRAQQLEAIPLRGCDTIPVELRWSNRGNTSKAIGSQQYVLAWLATITGNGRQRAFFTPHLDSTRTVPSMCMRTMPRQNDFSPFWHSACILHLVSAAVTTSPLGSAGLIETRSADPMATTTISPPASYPPARAMTCYSDHPTVRTSGSTIRIRTIRR